MHYIKLDTMQVKRPGDNSPPSVVQYREQLIMILSLPDGPQSGITISDMRRSIRVLDILEPARDGDIVPFEDADWEFIKRRIESTSFTFVDRAFIKFVDDIINAPIVAPMQVASEQAATA